MTLCLYDINFDIIHRAGIVNGATDVLARTKTRCKDYTDINDEIPVSVTDLSDDTNAAGEASR